MEGKMSCFLVREKEAKELKKSTIPGSPKGKAFVSRPINYPLSKNMTAGYLQLKPGYSLEIGKTPADEVDLFLEGSLTYNYEGKSFTAQKGDIAFIEKGTRAHFITEEGCLIFYVTYPLVQASIEALKKNK
jgi:ethanolamine utilization protein EutQ (cupin superfamily)